MNLGSGFQRVLAWPHVQEGSRRGWLGRTVVHGQPASRVCQAAKGDTPSRTCPSGLHPPARICILNVSATSQSSTTHWGPGSKPDPMPDISCSIHNKCFHPRDFKCVTSLTSSLAASGNAIDSNLARLSSEHIPTFML